LLVTEVKQRPAPAEHDGMAGLPRRDRSAISVKEHAELAHLAGMVHADDPFTPCDVLDRVSGVGPFPVQDRRDLQGGRVEKDILGAVVTVHEHLAVPCGGGEGRDLAGAELVDSPEHGAAGAQHAVRLAGFKQLLPMDAAHERHGQAPVAVIQDLWHRKLALQSLQHGVLKVGPGQRARLLVVLHDGRAVSERAVGVAVPQRPHPPHPC
jgi:hypothetical protein